MSLAPFQPRRRQVDAYIAHRRSIFYPKADEPVRKLRHEIIEREDHGEKLVYRYSTLKGSDLAMWVEAQVCAGFGGGTICQHFDRHLSVYEDAKGTYQVHWPAAGVALAEVTDPAVRQAAFAAIGRQLRKLHGFHDGSSRDRTLGAGFGFVYPAADRLCGVHMRWTDHLKTCLAAHTSELFGYERAEIMEPFDELGAIEHTLPRALLHADLSNHNIFVDPDTGGLTALLDWEDALIGDPLYDLADWATFHDADEDLWHICLDAYFGGRERPWDFERRFWTYFLRISLCKWVQHRRYETPDTTRSQKRVERALEKLS